MHWIKDLLSAPKISSREIARRLASDIRVQARRPDIYGGHAIPDTMDGRVAAMALFAGLVSARLAVEGKQGRKVSSQLNSIIFDEFDAALRETGVGDASIARKVRNIGERFVGLGIATNEALAGEDPDGQLQAVLIRNGLADNDGAPRLAHLILSASQRLSPGTLEGETGWGDL
jgi:cytochrome b pre-mRNA-processing protein 3